MTKISLKIGNTYRTNHSYELTLRTVVNGYYVFSNQFYELIRFNSRLEHVSLLGSNLQIIG